MAIEGFEDKHVGWAVLQQVVMFPEDEIVEAKLISFRSDDPDDDFDGAPIVQLIKKSPTIEFICANEQEAQELMEFLNKSRKVINFSNYKKDSNGYTIDPEKI